MKEFDKKIELEPRLKLTVDKNGHVEIGLSQHMKNAMKSYELHGETKEEDIYKCTYCGNLKADEVGFHASEDIVTKCIYCGNLSFEKTDVK